MASDQVRKGIIDLNGPGTLVTIASITESFQFVKVCRSTSSNYGFDPV
jgi:hypothetical protein